jgi:hypothetical protein
MRYQARGRFIAGFCGIVTSLIALFCQTALAADFTVTTPGSYFLINSKINPVLTLVRGQTYTFAVSTGATHPFEILSSGVSNNSITHGTVTYTVPTNAANYGYICPIHGFGANINTVAPPTPPVPPTVKIVGFSLTTNLTIRSTGTSTWSVLPQYSTNLGTTNWYTLTVQTNRYANGTNETICGRPPGNAVLIRVKAQQN